MEKLILTVSLTIGEDKFALSFDLAEVERLTETKYRQIFDTFKVSFAATLRKAGKIVNPLDFDS